MFLKQKEKNCQKQLMNWLVLLKIMKIYIEQPKQFRWIIRFLSVLKILKEKAQMVITLQMKIELSFQKD